MKIIFEHTNLHFPRVGCYPCLYQVVKDSAISGLQKQKTRTRQKKDNKNCEKMSSYICTSTA